MATPMPSQPLNQPRRAAGTPGGGQFAPDSRERAAVSLGEDSGGQIVVDMGSATSDDDYNATGSYSHPPIPRNARQVIAFWLTVRIPDHVLDQVAIAYTERSARRIAQSRANPASKGLRLSTRNRNAEMAQAADRQPEQIPPYLLTDVVRLCGMYQQSYVLEQSQADLLLHARFTTNNGLFEMTPEDAWHDYEFGGDENNQDAIADALLDTREADEAHRRDVVDFNLHRDLIAVRNAVARGNDQIPREDLSYYQPGTPLSEFD